LLVYRLENSKQPALDLCPSNPRAPCVVARSSNQLGDVSRLDLRVRPTVVENRSLPSAECTIQGTLNEVISSFCFVNKVGREVHEMYYFIPWTAFEES
jgi:hypothetical protein